MRYWFIYASHMGGYYASQRYLGREVFCTEVTNPKRNVPGKKKFLEQNSAVPDNNSLRRSL